MGKKFLLLYILALTFGMLLGMLILIFGITTLLITISTILLLLLIASTSFFMIFSYKNFRHNNIYKHF